MTINVEINFKLNRKLVGMNKKLTRYDLIDTSNGKVVTSFR